MIGSRVTAGKIGVLQIWRPLLFEGPGSKLKQITVQDQHSNFFKFLYEIHHFFSMFCIGKTFFSTILPEKVVCFTNWLKEFLTFVLPQRSDLSVLFVQVTAMLNSTGQCINRHSNPIITDSSPNSQQHAFIFKVQFFGQNNPDKFIYIIDTVQRFYKEYSFLLIKD